MSRPRVSAAPPGANGAMIFTGLVGQSCARAAVAPRQRRKTSPSRAMLFIILLPQTGERNNIVNQSPHQGARATTNSSIGSRQSGDAGTSPHRGPTVAVNVSGIHITDAGHV